jgi:carbon-monoxide dehydrogenase medium subunit
MKAAKFDYRRAGTLQEALGWLQEGEGGTKLLAGGQSLGPMLNLRLARPAMVVDISKVPELRSVSEDGGVIRIGACVTHAELEDGRFARLRGHPLQRAAGVIAYRAVRNRGTIGGSLAHADPAADWPVVLTALGAELELVSPRGSRRLAIDQFMQGAYTTALAADEILAAVRLPAFAASSRWGYYKLCRKPGEFAEASCAALFAPQARTARIAVGALDGAPRLLPELAVAVARDGLAAAGRDALLASVQGLLPQRDAVDHRLFASAVERCLAQALSEEAVA